MNSLTRIAVLLALASLASCVQTVPFHERRAFADPVMDLSTDPLEAHWFSKIHYSMEGSVGGFSSTGGGGCGCY